MKKLLFLVVALTTLQSTGIAVAADGNVQRPNFLFVYADDQRYDQIGVVQREQGEQARFPWFTTPNMDRLATEGVRFRNAFVTSSVCAPSRAAFLTGQYNHLNGVASNHRHFPLDAVTHASLLQAAGYTTAYIGKWHMDDQRERPNFDYHASFIGQGRYVDCPLLIQGVETPTEGWVDDVTTGYAIEFLEGQKDSGKPWSMVVGFKAPHNWYILPERAEKRFEGEMARPVPNSFVQAPYMAKQGVPFTPPVVKNGLVPLEPLYMGHFRCVSACDDNLGRLLDALDRFGYADNTVVIYTSDNGHYLGEHGLFDKRSAYDESLRIPFLVRFPKLGNEARGRVVDEPILNIDLAPTLLDYAGVPIPKEMQGRSWRPLAEGKKPNDWRKTWFYEYFADTIFQVRAVDITAVRSLDTKLIKYANKTGELTDWTEMYDLVNDPYEVNNLYNDPAHAKRQREIELEYVRLREEVGYKIPDYVDRAVWWDYGLFGSAPRLTYAFDKDSADVINDASGYGNHGSPVGKPVSDKGQNGEPAKRFDGKSWISLKKKTALNLANTPWTAEVVFKADEPNGVLVSVGGELQGYSLRLKEGKLVYTVTINRVAQTIAAEQPVSGWCKATAQLTADKKMVLYVGDRKVGERKLPSLIPAQPHNAYRIGSDSDVTKTPSNFVGVISSVKLFYGTQPPSGDALLNEATMIRRFAELYYGMETRNWPLMFQTLGH